MSCFRHLRSPQRALRSGVRLRAKVTPLLLSRDTVVTKNKWQTSPIVMTSGQRGAKGQGHCQAAHICWSPSV